MTATTEQIISIVGNDKEIIESWQLINPLVFYKGDDLLGLVAFVPCNGMYYVAATTTDPAIPFSTGMFRAIRKVNRDYDIIVITDVKEYHERVRALAEAHGFTITYSQDDENVMYSQRSATHGSTSRKKS